MKKFFHKIHLWLAIPFGLLITLEFLSGAVLVFEDDIVASAQAGGWVTSLGWDNPEPFFKGVKRLHRWLFDSPESKTSLSAGRAVIGISAIATSLILIGGIVIWIPKQLKPLRKRFTITAGKGLWRFALDWHKTIGICCVLFLLLMTLTGPSWPFGWYREGVFALLPDSESPMGTVLRLHTGKWGGIVVQFIYFFAALAGATLTISGYYLWYKKLQAKKKKPKRPAAQKVQK